MMGRKTRRLLWTGKGVNKSFENRNNWTPRVKPCKGDRCIVPSEGGTCPGPITHIDPDRTVESLSILPESNMMVIEV